MRTGFLVLGLAFVGWAGSSIPTNSVLVSERSNAAQVDLKGNGLLAFVRDTGFDVGIRLDLVQLETKDRYRISLDPLRDRTFRPDQQPLARWLAPDLVLQQLPEGHYTPFRIFLGGDRPTPFKADTFLVRKGEITSFGRLRIAPQLNFLGQMKQLDLVTKHDSLAPKLKAIHEHGIDSLPVKNRALRWAITGE
jgi:hypothetical protein